MLRADRSVISFRVLVAFWRYGTSPTSTGNGSPIMKTNIVRKPRARKPAAGSVNVASIVDVPSAMAFAKTVTPDTFANALAAINKTASVTHGGRNTNRFTGTRIEYTQNETFVRNVDAQLSDVQLAFVWCACFPMATGRVFEPNRAIVGGNVDAIRAAIAESARIVNGARNTFNAGKHGCPAPSVPAVRYGDRKTTFATVTAAAAPKR